VTGFCPSVKDIRPPVGYGTKAFNRNDFWPCPGLSQFKNNIFKKNFGTDILTRIESGLIGYLNAYMCINY